MDHSFQCLFLKGYREALDIYLRLGLRGFPRKRIAFLVFPWLVIEGL